MKKGLYHPYPWLVIPALLLAIQIGPWWRPTPDAIAYLSAGRSLVRDGELRVFGSPDLPFPPGYAILVSPIFLVTDRPFALLLLLNWVLAVVLILGLFRWYSRHDLEAAGLLTGWVAVNVCLWTYFQRPLKEMAFMAVFVWTVTALNLAAEGPSRRQRIGRTLSAALLMICLVLFREAGILLAAAFGIQLLIEVRGRRLPLGEAAAMWAVVTAPALFVVRRYHHRIHLCDTCQATDPLRLTGFVGWLTKGVEELAEGVRLRVFDTGRLLVPGMFSAYSTKGWLSVNTLVYAAVFAVVIVGWWAAARRRSDAFVYVLPLYLVLYMLWPVDQGPRFLLVLLPALQLSVWVFLSRFGQRRRRAVMLLVGAHLLVSLGRWIWVEMPVGRRGAADWEHAERLAGPLMHRGDVAAAASVPEGVRLSLEFLLNAPVRRVAAAEQPPAGARSLVAARGDPQVPGFLPYSTAGPYAVLLRVHGSKLRPPGASER